MSAEITDTTGKPVALLGGERGVFDVLHNGKVLFSKHQTGRFPNPGEIRKLLST